MKDEVGSPPSNANEMEGKQLVIDIPLPLLFIDTFS